MAQPVAGSGFRPATAGDSAAFCTFVFPLRVRHPHTETTPLMGPLECRSAMLSVTPHGAWGPVEPVATQPAALRHRGLRPLGRRGAERPPKTLPHRLREYSRCFTWSIPFPAGFFSIHTGLQRHCFGRTRKPSTCCGRGARACVPPTYRSARRNWRCRPCYTCPNQHGPSLSPLRHGCIPEWATRSVFLVRGVWVPGRLRSHTRLRCSCGPTIKQMARALDPTIQGSKQTDLDLTEVSCRMQAV